MMRARLKTKCIPVLLGLGLSLNVAAGPISLVGTTVTYTFDDTLLGLFGMPILAGDSLIFSPGGFRALSSNGTPPLDFTSATMNIQARPNDPTNWLGMIRLTEGGEYRLDSSIPGLSGVEVGGQIRVRDLNSLDELTNSIIPASSLTTTGGTPRTWSASASVDASAWMSNLVNITVENQLIAYTVGSSTFATIEKDWVELSVTARSAAMPVPEPQTLVILLTGIGLMGMLSGRDLLKRGRPATG